MLAAFFRSNQPAVLVSAPLVAAALFAPSFWHQPVAEGPLMPVAELVQRALGDRAWAHGMLGIVLITAVAMQLAVLINSLELMERRNHLAVLSFPVVLAGVCGPGAYDPALLGLPLVLFALRRSWSISNTGPALAALFDAGLLLGLASLCYLPYALLLAVLWSSTSLIRPFAWREYLLPVLAVAVVFGLTWITLHLAGLTPWRPLHTVMSEAMQPAVLWDAAARKGFVSLLALVVLFAAAAFAGSYAHSVMRGKNLRLALLALTLALAAVIALLGLMHGGFPAVLAALPLGVLVAYPFLKPKRGWLAELALSGMTGLAVWVRWSAI